MTMDDEQIDKLVELVAYISVASGALPVRHSHVYDWAWASVHWGDNAVSVELCPDATPDSLPTEALIGLETLCKERGVPQGYGTETTH